MGLKEKLLNIPNLFEDNEYLDLYCDLIENNKINLDLKTKS